MDEFPTLIEAGTLRQRIAELARAVAAAYPDEPPVVVSVIEGARVFAEHLMQALPWSVPVHEIRASSYGSGTTRGERVEVGGPTEPVRGRRVLLVEDIVDTGHTIARLLALFVDAGAASVDVVTLLSKPSRRETEVDLRFVGFEIPNEFVIGFGMDVAGRYRDLQRVAIYDAALEARA